jgi:hypothetical protein
MFELKPLHPNAIPRALEKAERYRLLNEPEEAESICQDILVIDSNNQQALIMLLLALTDQFGTHLGDCFRRAHGLVPRLQEEYDRCYYSGILCERRGNAHLHRHEPDASAVAYDWFREAMTWYERAEAIRQPENDDAILRWNTCVRTIQKHNLRPATAESYEPVLQE